MLAITDFVAETEILLVSDGEARPFASSGFNEGGADFSPDGRFIVYISDETGRNEVYVRPFPGPGPKVLISTDGGVEVSWGRHGSEIFYRNGEKMMAVPVVTEPEFRHRAPVVLFEAPYELALNVDRRNYDVNADGTEFVMIHGQGDETLAQLSVVLNWTALLKPPP